MPKPNLDETRDDFIQRCMKDTDAVNDFPETEQRFAFCSSAWEQAKAEDKSHLFKQFEAKKKAVQNHEIVLK